MDDGTCDSCYVVCPYCGAEHGDAWEICKEHPTDRECEKCEKTFKCWAEYDVTYHAEPIEPAEKPKPPIVWFSETGQ